MKSYAYILNFLAYTDQKMRESNHYDETLDRKNQHILEKIVAKIGFPSISKVGRKASWNAWLIAQHADIDFMQKYYILLTKEHETEYDDENKQYLEDRILSILHGRQIHGTQYKKDSEGNLKKVPLINESEGERLLLLLI